MTGVGLMAPFGPADARGFGGPSSPRALPLFSTISLIPPNSAYGANTDCSVPEGSSVL